MQKGFAQILVVVLFLVGLASLGLYYASARNSQPVSSSPTSSPISTSTPLSTSTPDPTENWKTYTNQKWGITFKYPEFFDLSTNLNDTTDPKGNIYPGISIRLQVKEKCDFVLGAGDSCIVVDFAVSTYRGYLVSPDINTTRKIGDLVYSVRDLGIMNDSTMVQFFTEKPNLHVVVQYRISEQNKSKYPNLIDQILSTFKFTK